LGSNEGSPWLGIDVFFKGFAFSIEKYRHDFSISGNDANMFHGQTIQKKLFAFIASSAIEHRF